MRTFQLPNVVGQGLMVGSLVLMAAAPIAAAESASSVSFANRDALKATDTNGWRNPLRSGANATSRAASGNSLRQNVTPVSYEEEMGVESPDGAGQNSRAPRGLQLRPHAQPTGVFSSFIGEGSKSTAYARSAAASARQPQFRQPQTKPLPASTATRQAFSMLPQFKSSAARKQSQAGAVASQAAMNARAGSAMRQSAQMPTHRPATRMGTPAAYNTAASAQAYRHKTPPGGVAAKARRPITATQARQSAATPTIPSGADASSPAAILLQAHQLAETSRSEADFSRIYALCQQIPARTATAEEAAFGRQLAAWALNRRGQFRARAGNNEAAMADFGSAIRIDAKCWRALHNRGVLLAQAGQFEPAFDDFHQTIELSPNFAKAYANRGALYVLAGELEPGLADYRQAAELDPNFAIAQRGCGRTCHMLGRVDEALEHLTRAIELAPQDAAALASRGDLLTDLGQYEAAASDYEQALAINQNYADAYRGSAWLLATCPDGTVRNPGVALERAQKAVKLERKPDATTFDTLAAAQASAGDFRAAMQTIRRAIELAPPSERSVYQDRMQMYRQSKPYRIEPLASVQQAGYAP
jgi:tetratricopeptide (TPR) repeat protein